MKITHLIFLTFFLFGSQVFGQGFLKAENSKIVNENGENVLLRGIGLGGYMLQEGYMLQVPFSGQQYVFKEHVEELVGKEKTEQFYAAWRKNHMQKRDVDSLKQWGFNSIRLPLHYNLFTLPVDEEPVAGKNTWLEEGFQLTDSLLKWCKANKMYLILDMHAAPGGQGHDVNISDRNPSKPSLWESEANQQKLIAVWQKLAERYKDETWIGAYDLLNEPNWTFENGKNENGIEDTENKPLRKLLEELTKAVREIDTNHIVIIEGNGWGNNYNGVLPPWDTNIVLSFHKYWNYNDTASIQQFLEYRNKYNIPVWLGESGENSNVWFRDAISLMEENNIGWCWWPLKKLGFNNPLEIKINKGYRDLLNYWAEKSEKPSSEEAFEALMQLAENAKIENCIVHYDVLDAIIRQPKNADAIPFKYNQLKNQLVIKAADYDLGTDGVAYHDTISANYHISTGKERQTWNLGRTYRNDGVDLFKINPDNEAVYVGDLEQHEWLHYTVNTNEAGAYSISLKISSNTNTGKASLLINDRNTTPINIENTADKWEWTAPVSVYLKAGKNTIKLLVEHSGFNLQSIKISN
ncbi:cellulase family glycosylhydrolase [Leeuwenhoekiella aequorea]|uniref:Carbohydrate binding protein with CBM6 domain n=1 Tax=Leeuwenhoekiella aequorea TaxID=283736 RepID=A0A4Q0PDV5_9FLAO|nr:cellulase family glycosylhydrolase [Leeuwenhoekiella aequorea]RXG24249.1 carbohydrate binding protein with CBM6 domain [Leeuwenhoekiella aequorea]